VVNLKSVASCCVVFHRVEYTRRRNPEQDHKACMHRNPEETIPALEHQQCPVARYNWWPAAEYILLRRGYAEMADAECSGERMGLEPLRMEDLVSQG
jgi:hypothetical protein